MKGFRGGALFFALIAVAAAPALADGWAYIDNQSSNCVSFALQPLWFTQDSMGPKPVGSAQRVTIAAGAHLSIYVSHGTPYYRVTADPHDTDCASPESGHVKTIWPNIGNTKITYAAGGYLTFTH